MSFGNEAKKRGEEASNAEMRNDHQHAGRDTISPLSSEDSDIRDTTTTEEEEEEQNETEEIDDEATGNEKLQFAVLALERENMAKLSSIMDQAGPSMAKFSNMLDRTGPLLDKLGTVLDKATRVAELKNRMASGKAGTSSETTVEGKETGAAGGKIPGTKDEK